MPREQKTMADVIRKAAIADGRSIFILARDANVPYSVLYRFIKGDKTGHRQGLTLMTADKLAKALNLELRPKKKGK